MRILFVTIFRRGFGGGDNQMAWDLAETLAKQGNDVSFVCLGDKHKIVVEDGIKVVYIETEGRDSVSFPALTRKAIQYLYSYLDSFHPEIIHAHTDDPLSMLIQIWAHFKKVHFLYTTHILPSKAAGFSVSDILPFMKTISKPALELNIRAFLNNCTALVAINKSSYEDLIKFGYTGEVRVIRNGRDLSQYSSLKLPTVEKGKPVNLIFVGLINERKNQLYLLNILLFLPTNYVLTLIGESITNDYRNQLVLFIKEHRLQNRVHLVSRVPYKEIPTFLEKSYIFVSASKMEVQSLVVLEALAAGRPVIGLENETISELIVNGFNGYKLKVDSEPRIFAEKIKEVVEHPALYSQMARNARKSVADYDINEVTLELTDYYRYLLKKGYPKYLEPSNQEKSVNITSGRFSYIKSFPQIAWSTIDKYLYLPYKRVAKVNIMFFIVGISITVMLGIVYSMRSMKFVRRIYDMFFHPKATD